MKHEIDCLEILKLLKSDYLDNELDDSTRKQVDQHLAECPACRSAKEKLAAISLALRNAPRVTPPENLWPRIQKEIRTTGVPHIKQAEHIHVRFTHFFARKKAFAFAAAAALVIAATGFYLGTSRTDNGATAPSLTAILGYDETRDLDMNFESAIEKYFL